MAKSTIDAYSLCPGGTGKKIKFCCNDLLGDLQKIDQMLQSNQPRACLNHIDGLLKSHPDRACLLAIRGLVLRATDQPEEAEKNARRLIEHHPDSQVAQAEMAIAATNTDGVRAAMDFVQRAMEVGKGGVQTKVYEALGATAMAAIRENCLAAARALLQMQASLQPEDETPVRLLMRLFGSASIPLLLRDEPRWLPMPEDAPWAGRLQEALQLEQSGQWRKVEPMLAELAGQFDNEPVLWQQLARVRGQLADRPGQAEALRRFAELAVPWDDAVEAEAIAMMLGDDPLGDRVELGDLRWDIADVPKLEEALAFDKRAVAAQRNPAERVEGEGPPPKSVYWLLDRRAPSPDDDVSPETVPQLLGQLRVFGRQTDQPARLELPEVSRPERDTAESLLQEIAADALAAGPDYEVVGHASASQDMLQARWWPPENADRDQISNLLQQHQQETLLKHWLDRPLGVLGGRPPREAAGASEDPRLRRRLAAAVLVLQAMTERLTADFDFNRLREELNLPAAGPIDPDELPLDQLPVIRYDRVLTEKLDNESLLHGFRKASVFRSPRAMRLFARAVIDRGELAGSDEGLRAYTTLAQLETDPEKAAAIYDQGRAAADAAGRSHANFDLAELAMWFARGAADRVGRLMDHIQREHGSESGVQEALVQMLVQFGVLNPDGTPGPAMTGGAQAPAGGTPGAAPGMEPAGAVPGQPPPPAAEPGKLWTPDSGAEADRSAGGKLWTPD